jgi:RND superfamily putative drug exporter
VIDDKTTFDLDSDCIIGRDPHERTGFRTIRIADPEKKLSRVHAEIRLVNDAVYIVDRASRNGTFVRSATSAVWTRLDPWSAEVWNAGLMVKVGEHILRLEPAGRILSAGARQPLPPARSPSP